MQMPSRVAGSCDLMNQAGHHLTSGSNLPKSKRNRFLYLFKFAVLFCSLFSMSCSCFFRCVFPKELGRNERSTTMANEKMQNPPTHLPPQKKKRKNENQNVGMKKVELDKNQNKQ